MNDSQQDGDDDGKNGTGREVSIDGRDFSLGRFGLCGSLPLEQALASDEASDERAGYGVQRKHGLVGKESKIEHRDENGLTKTGEGVEDTGFLLAEDDADEAKGEVDQSRGEEQENGNEGPVKRPSGKAEPSGHEQDEGEGLDEGAAKVVEDFPARDGGDGIADKASGFVGNAAEEPLRDLPVAPHPAMLAAGIGAVVGGVVVDNFDIGGEAGAGVGSFNEIVAEEGVAREALLENCVEGIDLIN